MRNLSLLLIFSLIFSGLELVAQPCLQDFLYRVPVTINNPAATDTTGLVEVVFSARSLIDDGKMQSTCADLRFVDENNEKLDFWIDENNPKTDQQSAWVKLNSLPNGGAIIYMFYGNYSALSQSTTGIFEFYEGFNGNNINAALWQTCGGTAGISGGKLQLSANSALVSMVQYPRNYAIEAYISGVTGTGTSLASLGQNTSTNLGYALSYNSNQSRFEINDLTGGACPYANTSLGSNTIGIGPYGVWGLSWELDNQISGKTTTTNLSLGLPSIAGSGSTNIFASVKGTGSMEIDWIRVRDIQGSEITASLGAEETIGVTPDVILNGNAPVCSGNSLELRASYIDGANYEWFYESDPVPIHSGVNEYAHDITGAGSSNSGTYSVIVTLGTPTCNTKAAQLYAQVDAPLDTGHISFNTSVCYGQNAGQVELTGFNSTIERWQLREGLAGMWEDRLITDSIFPYAGLTTTHTFRALVSSGACGSGYTSGSTIWVDAPSISGTLSENAIVCKNNTDTLFLTGSQGSIQQWQTSPDNSSWTTINSFTGSVYEYRDIDTTTYFRALVKSGVCPVDTTNTVKVTVNQPTNGGVVGNGKIVCSQNPARDTLYLTGYTGNINQWEYAPTANGPWTVQAASEDYFIYQGLTFDSYYRVQVESPGCEKMYSLIDTVIVETKPDAGELTGNADVCETSNAGSIKLNAYSGKIVAWHKSFENSSWSETLSNYDTLNYSGLTDTVYYRALVNTQHEVCTPDTSNTVKISVSEATRAGNLYPDTITACIGSGIETLKLHNYLGTINRWESSTTGGSPWSTINIHTDSLEVSSLLNSTWYRVAVQSGVCNEEITDFTYIKIDQETVGGIISGATEVCELVNTGTLNLFGHTGAVVKWEGYTTAGGWTTVPNTFGAELHYNGLIDTTTYRAIIKNGVCPYDTSATAKITVNPLPDVSFSAAAVNLNDPTVFQNSTTIPGGLVQTWQWDFGNEESSSSKNPSYTYPAEGVYRVKLSATSNKGCLDSASANAEVFGLPDVSFTFENVCLYGEMFFTNTSLSGSGTTYSWKFGDGDISADQDFTSHFYNEAGTYTVTLTAYSASGGVDSVSKTVEVYPRSAPAFKFDNVCAGNEVKFTNFTASPTPFLTYQWDFGNSLTDTRTDPETTYEEEGRFAVTLTVTTSDGCTDFITDYVNVYPVPVAAFTVEDVPYEQPSVFFNGSSITNGNLHYLWEFGDENKSDTTHPVYYYESPGVYPVTLSATSDSGCENSIRKSVKIFDLPVVQFSYNDVCFGDSMAFLNESTIPSGSLSFEWDFGDKNTSEEVSPYHLYNQPGIYTVRLISISNNGARDTVWKDVKVSGLPQVDFTFNEACHGYTTKFTNQSLVGDSHIAGVLWDFGDGTNSIQLNPEKDFLNPKIYPVTLEVSSANGCINTTTKEVIVHRIPVADFSVLPVCFNKTSEFVNASFIDNTDRPYTLVYSWDFEDGSVSGDFEPDHRFGVAGNYQVQLVVSSDAGCYDTLYRLAEVYPLPLADAGKDTTVTKGFPISMQASGGEFYEWEPPEGLSDPLSPESEARPMETTTYTLRVSDENSCINYDTVTITVDDAQKIIPSNILTPNNNNENDTWNIVNIDSYPEAEITIFDRWGKVIYETAHYNNDWQGVNKNGDILPDGTYYYVITLNGTTGVTYKGAITILRDK